MIDTSALQTAPVEICSECHYSIPPSISIPSLNPCTDFNTPLNRSVAGRLLEDIEAELSRYDQYIAQLKSVLRSVEQEHDKLLEHRDKWRHAISPIRRLPVEMLTEIFTLLCDDSAPYDVDDDTDPSFRYATDEDPFLPNPVLWLSQVCNQWRTILLALPNLWASIVIDLRHDTRTSPRAVQLHLERSKPLHLSIRLLFPSFNMSSIDCRGDVDDVHWDKDPRAIPCTCSATVLSYLIEESIERWGSLLLSEFVPMWRGLLSSVVGRLDNLTVLRIYFADVVMDDEDCKPFIDIPSLKHVELQECLLYSSIPRHSWQGLKTLYLSDTNISVVLALLSNSPGIVHVRLHSILSDSRPRRMAVSTSVTSLSLQHYPGDGASEVLPWITFPNIDDLYTSIPASQTSALCAFLDRSQATSNLQSLAISVYDHVECVDNMLVKILDHTPQLETLDTTKHNLGKEFLEYLTCTPMHQILPRLSELSFSCLDDQLDRLALMLESRILTNGPATQLEKVSLSIMNAAWKPSSGKHSRPCRSGCFPSSFVSRMNAIISAGVRMHISPPLEGQHILNA